MGFGTWQLSSKQATQSVLDAIDIGFRFIDTAQIYKNEDGVGKALKKTDVPREELVVATKVWVTRLTPNWLKRSVDKSLEKLKLDYVDILYVHWPALLYSAEKTIPALNDVLNQGKTKYIAVSNFTPKLIKEAIEQSDAPIVANQIECHPYLQQKMMRDFLKEREIYLVGYSPLARGKVFQIPEIREIAEKHQVSAAQVSLAWSMQKGVIPIPKATSRNHIEDNYQALSLDLKKKDIETIDNIDKEKRLLDSFFLSPDWGKK